MTTKKEKPALPPNNPYLIQDSLYPMTHFNSAQTDVTNLAGGTDDWTVKPSQTRWLPGVALIGTAHIPYPDGEQAIFFAGTNRVGKIRITDSDFSLVDEIFVPGYEQESISTTDIRCIVKEMLDAGTPVTDDYPARGNEFNGKIK